MSDTTGEALRRREAALRRFERWQAANPADPSPQAALASLGRLYELLPPEARQRPIDPAGVAALHRCLAVLGRS